MSGGERNEEGVSMCIGWSWSTLKVTNQGHTFQLFPTQICAPWISYFHSSGVSLNFMKSHCVCWLWAVTLVLGEVYFGMWVWGPGLCTRDRRRWIVNCVCCAFPVGLSDCWRSEVTRNLVCFLRLLFLCLPWGFWYLLVFWNIRWRRCHCHILVTPQGHQCLCLCVLSHSCTSVSFCNPESFRACDSSASLCFHGCVWSDNYQCL